jgi:Xaa-Pro aminopeptidase
MGYELSTSFIHKPHECDPRRLYSQTGADWQYRVDFDRMRAERLQRTRDQMEAYDLGALVLFAGANIRYVTGSYQGNWKYNINIRYVVLPRGGEPVFFETAGSDLHCAVIDLPWIPENNMGRRGRASHGQEDDGRRHGGSEGKQG